MYYQEGQQLQALFQILLQEGRTPLHYSAALRDSGIFYRYLLKCGADENIQDKVLIMH